jgi:dipeptidyl aminopeptidase/acylaminoacyl peptidase
MTVDLLWQLQRLGAPSLSPDGAQAVCAVTQPSMEDNLSRSGLWLLSTLGGQPRPLTQGEKDSQPQFSPTGEWIAFTARRERQGVKDTQTQLYLIAPDGGEARLAAEVPTGVEAFQWFADGQRIALISWVWPHLRGQAAQKRQAAEMRERKETAFATEDAVYRHWDDNLPQDRVPHLLMLDVRTGRVTDLLEGSGFELGRRDHSAADLSISPDGRRIVCVVDPQCGQHPAPRMALAEIELTRRGSPRVRTLLQDKDWDFSGPRHSADGRQLAFLASHQAQRHTMPNQIALAALGGQRLRWQVISEGWDREPKAPLHWSEDGSALLCLAEDRGRQHVWRFDLADRSARVVAEGGTVQTFDARFGTLVTLTDTAHDPGRIEARPLTEAGQGVAGAPRRIENFNGALLAGLRMGKTEEHWVKGARGDAVQVWVHYPPGFDPRRKYPLLHTIHGGPHTGPGDTWHWRWNYHVFAAQGYVTVNVNYHGSSGFGHAFLDAITHQWGALELQDIEAATDWLLRNPWIDRKRLFATGGSYGGYMVAWMNAHLRKGRYRAYICHAGCYDWTGMFADDAYGWHAQELGAWYWDDIDKVHSQSPHAHAHGLSTPTLVIHGAKDYRVPDAQGLAYYNTLKAQGIDARLLWFPDENHWILKPRNSAVWYQEFFDWLRRHDPGARPVKSAKGR